MRLIFLAETTDVIHQSVSKVCLMMSYTYQKTEMSYMYQKTEIIPVLYNIMKPNVPRGDEGDIRVVEHFKYIVLYCSAYGASTKVLN